MFQTERCTDLYGVTLTLENLSEKAHVVIISCTPALDFSPFTLSALQLQITFAISL